MEFHPTKTHTAHSSLLLHCHSSVSLVECGHDKDVHSCKAAESHSAETLFQCSSVHKMPLVFMRFQLNPPVELEGSILKKVPNMYVGVSKNFWTESITKQTTIIYTR
jgi:hypothetical protein